MSIQQQSPIANRQSEIYIDGSHGEGGGQVLRTSLSLSLITGRPLRMDKIRAGRIKPGLQPQHLACVRAAAAMSSATVEGDALGSQTLAFAPGPVRPGDYTFNVAEERGSAGAATLVLQTVLLPLAFSSSRFQVAQETDCAPHLTILGGTHVPWSPCYHYVEQVYLPTLAQLGIQAQSTITRWGFYPVGGGEIGVTVSPTDARHQRIGPNETSVGVHHPLERLVAPGCLLQIRGISAVANLPLDIARRQRTRVRQILLQYGLDAQIELVEAPARSPGTAVFLLAQYEHAVAGFSALGERGKPAERVADEAVQALLAHHRSGAALDPHLADQIILPLAIIGEAAEFTTSQITEHLVTNIWVVEQFLGPRFTVEGGIGEAGTVRMEKVSE